MKRLSMGCPAIIAAAVLFSFVGSSHATQSMPLMLLIAGGLRYEVGRTSMQRLYDEEFRRECDGSPIQIELIPNRKLLQSDYQRFKNEVDSYVKGHTNIVLIGHSLGGHAAYKIARFLLTEKTDTSVLLLTLDPTSFSWGGRFTIEPGLWHNVYLRGLSLFSVIRWGYEPPAFRNYRFYGGSFSGHFQVTHMFKKVREKVMKHMGYPCSN